MLNKDPFQNNLWRNRSDFKNSHIFFVATKNFDQKGALATKLGNIFGMKFIYKARTISKMTDVAEK